MTTEKNEAIAHLKDALVAMACVLESMTLAVREMAAMMDGIDWSRVELDGNTIDEEDGSGVAYVVSGGSLDDAVWFKCGDCGRTMATSHCELCDGTAEDKCSS